MSTGKQDLRTLIGTIQQLLTSRMRDRVTETYFNSLNESKSDMVNRLMQCVWHAEYALSKRVCKPGTDHCLRARSKASPKKRLSVKRTRAADLTEDDFVFMQNNLDDAGTARDLYWLARRKNRLANVEIFIVEDMDHYFGLDAETLVQDFLSKHTPSHLLLQ